MTEPNLLSREYAEISTATIALGSFFGRLIAEAGIVDKDIMADRLEHLADVLGQELAKLTNTEARPNPQILSVAEGLRQPDRLQLIEGGKD